jgi:dTDP-4-amino-4,6-dideoxygalactose transaminase
MCGNLAIQPAYRNSDIKIPNEMPNTKIALNNTFFIGCHPFLTDEQKNRIIHSFDSFFKNKQEFEI